MSSTSFYEVASAPLDTASIWLPGQPAASPLIEWQMKGISASAPALPWDANLSGVLYSDSFGFMSGLAIYILKAAVTRANPPTVNTILSNTTLLDTTPPTLIWTPGAGAESNSASPTVINYDAAATGRWALDFSACGTFVSGWKGGVLQIYTNRLRLVISFIKDSVFGAGYVDVSWEYQWI